MSNLKSVKVVMEDPTYNYVTSVNASVTFADIRKYFVGQRLSFGVEGDVMVTCVDVIEVGQEGEPSQ